MDNVQNGDDDCGTYEVSLNQLRELRDLCAQVVGSFELRQEGTHRELFLVDGRTEERDVPTMVIQDTSVAEELLPCSDGFFFGSTSFDLYYLHDVEFAGNRLNEILGCFEADESGSYSWDPVFDDDDWSVSFSYHASW